MIDKTIKYESNRKNVDKAMSESISKGLDAVGLFVVGRAMLLCIADTGRLRNSIHYATSEKVSKIGPKGDKRDQATGKAPMNEVHIGTNVEYALKVEKGRGQKMLGDSKETNLPKSASRKRAKLPKPFLTPAVEQNKKTIQAIFAKELKKLDK